MLLLLSQHPRNLPASGEGQPQLSWRDRVPTKSFFAPDINFVTYFKTVSQSQMCIILQ